MSCIFDLKDDNSEENKVESVFSVRNMPGVSSFIPPKFNSNHFSVSAIRNNARMTFILISNEVWPKTKRLLTYHISEIENFPIFMVEIEKFELENFRK